MTIPAESRTLERVFAPASIVVVGASANPAKRGNHVLRALDDSGYPGAVYAVNPAGGSAHGVDFSASIADLPGDVDLALVSLPASATPKALLELAERGVAGAVLLASGFAESPEAGATAEAELRHVLATTDLRVIGPNTSGFLNVRRGVNLVGVDSVEPGPIAVLTQSGNMLLSLIADDRAHRGPGIAAYVGLGNQSDISYAECIEYFGRDPDVGAIAMHVEGLRDGRAVLEAAAAVVADRPLVMLRGGRSVIGKAVAFSHTASIAGSDEVASALLRQAGVELVDRSDELAVVAGVLATTPPLPYGSGVAVLADGGGHATLTVDGLVAQRVPLATLGPATRAQLRAVLGPSAVIANPIDVAGSTDTDPGLFSDAVEVLMRDPGVGLVLVVGLYGGYHRRFDGRLKEVEEQDAARVVELAEHHAKPVIVQSCYARDALSPHAVLRANGVPVVDSIDHAVRSVAALARRGRRLATAGLRSTFALTANVPADSAEEAILLSEPEARRLLEPEGIVAGEWQVASSAEGLASALRQFGVPCAVKIVADHVAHKSEIGGVWLDVVEPQAAAIWDGLLSSVAGAVPQRKGSGLLVSPMAPSGVELLVGAHRDPIFGPVVAFGLGGFLVEAVRDVSFRAAPLTELEAEELMEETTASRLLDGYRSRPAVDRSALARLLVAVGDVMVARPEIVELDLNPVVASGKQLCTVDVRVVVRGRRDDD
jgi:acetyltransferase